MQCLVYPHFILIFKGMYFNYKYFIHLVSSHIAKYFISQNIQEYLKIKNK